MEAQAAEDNRNGVAEPYIFEDFEGTTAGALPAGWSGDFEVRTAGGVNNSRRLTDQLFLGTSSWQSPLVEAGSNPILRFMYRVVDDQGNPDNPDNAGDATAAGNFIIHIRIKTADDDAFELLHTIDDGNHVEAHTYALKQVDIPAAYEDEDIIIQAEVIHQAGFFWVDFDDVVIGTLSQSTFTITDTSSDPIQGAAIALNGPVNTSITTDASGVATTILPDGSYTFTVSATNYLTYDTGAFDVDGADITPAVPNLIGNFPVTFDVTDQDAAPLASVLIQWEGEGQSYNGTQSLSGSLLTNASGTAQAALPDGSYTWSATREDYYPVDGNTLVMDNAPVTESFSMQQFPEVTFTVTEGSGDNAGDPIEGAAISISGVDVPDTDAGGQSSVRLTGGDYDFSVSKIGYQPVSGDFTLDMADDLAVPVALEEAEPTFVFLQPEEGELVFRNMLVGKNSPVAEVSFTNTGSGTIDIAVEDITIQGADAGDFTIASAEGPFSLATGEEASIELVFAPLSAGTKNAVLQIEDNINGGKAIQTIDLMGIGYEPRNVPFFDNFVSGTLDNWVVVNDGQVNQWHAGEPAADEGNLAAIVSNDGGVTNAYQIVGATSRSHFYMDFDIPVAEEDKEIYLTFDWKGIGEAFDILRYYIIDPAVNPVGGSLLSGALGTFFGEEEWQTVTHVIPEEKQGSVQRIAFSWINNISGGQQPPAAVDNIYIGNLYELTLDVSPAGAGIVTGEGSYRGNLTVPLTATAEEGYTFSHWSAPAGSFADENDPETTFTMPAEDVTVTANFTFGGPAVNDVLETYDGTEHSLAAGVPDGVDVIWYEAETGGDPIDVPTSVDVAVITAWAATTENGVESQRTQATLTVEARPVEVTADADLEKVYGEVDPPLTYTVTGGDVITGDDFSGALERDTGEDAGEYAINEGDLSLGTNYDLTVITEDIVFTITPKPLTVINAVAQDKTYDGTDVAAITGAELDGVLAADEADVTLADGDTGTFDQAGVGADIPVSTSMSLEGAQADNYSLTQPEGLQAGITPAPLEVIANDITKTEGVEYTFAGDEFTTDPETLFATDEVTSVTLASDGAAETAALGEYPITIADAVGTGLANYTITYTDGTMTVTEVLELELTLPDLMVEDKTYDGTTDAVIAQFGALAGIDPDFPDVELVTTAVTATFTSADAAEDIEVTVAGFALSGDDADVYFIEDILTTATINPVALTVAADDQSKDYGDDDPALTFALTEGALLGDDELTGALTREAGEDAGTYAIEQGTLTAGDNYAITFVEGTFTILALPLTITPDDGQEKVYGEADPVLTWSLTDGALIGTDEITGLLGREAGEDVGDYEILPGTLTAGINYTLTVAEDVLFTITPKPLTVINAVAQDKTYDGSTLAIISGALLQGKVSGDQVNLQNHTIGTFAQATVGNDIPVATAMTLTGEQQGNYTLVQPEGLSADIIPAPLNVIASDITKIEGVEYTFSGNEYTTVPSVLAGGNAVTSVDLASDGAAAAAEPGTYAITVSGAQGTGLENYMITYTDGTMTVLAQQTLTLEGVVADDKEYDGTTAATISDYGTLTGINPDYPNVQLVTTIAQASFATADAGDEITVTVTNLNLSGSDAPLYTISDATTTAAITPRDITVTADEAGKVYGEEDPIFTYSVTMGSLVSGDSFSGALAREEGEAVGTYDILQGTLDAGANYVLTFEGAQLTIAERPITVTADNVAKFYGEDDPELTWTLTAGSLVFDDALVGEPEREPGEDVGTYDILQGTLDAGANYDLTFVEGELAIAAQAIVVTADAQSKVYGDDDPDLTFTLSTGELMPGDAFTGELSREPGEAVGSYTITQGTLSAGDNYIVVFEEGVLTITPLTLTIGGSFAVADKDYDGTTDATITDNQLTLPDALAGDDVALTGVVAVFTQAEPGEDIPVVLESASLEGDAAANYTLTLEGAPTTTATIIAPEPDTWQLTLVVEPANSGTATGAGTYEEGEQVALTAIANANFEFVNWLDEGGNVISTNEEYTFTMPGEDVTLTAQFQPVNTIGDLEAEALRLFPNPAASHVNVEAGSPIQSVIITDLSGRVAFADDAVEGLREMTINTGSFRPGIYLVRITTTEGMQVLKLNVNR